jgi:Ca2+/Na+ antiporter
MASPPAAVGVVILGGAGITAAMVWTVLMWIAIIGIVLLLLYLVYKLIEWARSRPRAVPRAVPKDTTKERQRRDRRRRARRKRRLFWNAALPYPPVVVSGGMVGTLDTDFAGGLFHLEGHHVWPKYVGGPEVQPLMSLRFEVHRGVVHPGLHLVMAGAALPMGFTLVINRTNRLFIEHLRRTPSDRAIFAGVMLTFYGGVGASATPPVPPGAYVPGIARSAATLS